MLSKQLVEQVIVLRREIRAIPPEPVASLGGVDFAQRLVLLLDAERAGVDLLLQKTARIAEQIPRAVFLLLADPDVEVRANPRAGVQCRDMPPRRAAVEIILDRAARQPRAFRRD